MTMISCLEECMYQKEGVCMLEDVRAANISGDERCVFFAKK